MNQLDQQNAYPIAPHNAAAASKLPFPRQRLSLHLQHHVLNKPVLMGSKPIRDELAALTRATAERLTSADRRAIAANDTNTLAAALGIAPATAATLATTVTQVTKANTLVLSETRKLQMSQALTR